MTRKPAWATISAARKQGQGNHAATPTRAWDTTVRPPMQTIILTNDPVRISFLRALLRDGGIDCQVFDEFASGVDGSIGAVPRRLVVADDDAELARAILAEAGEG